MKQVQLGGVVSVVFLAMLLDGCGIANLYKVREDFEISKAQYMACLEQNPQAPTNCESLRLAYEADRSAYISNLAWSPWELVIEEE